MLVRTRKAPPAKDFIGIQFNLSKTQCGVGESVDFEVQFSRPITVPQVVPISVSDRNGNHVTNIGISIVDGRAVGRFTPPHAGDFTVTNEAINYHRVLIDAELQLISQPWLRVYQI